MKLFDLDTNGVDLRVVHETLEAVGIQDFLGVVTGEESGKVGVQVGTSIEGEYQPRPLTEAEVIDIQTALDSVDVETEQLNQIKREALEAVRRQAGLQENRIDNLISGNFVRAIMLNTEVVNYVQSGRPANPSANVYAIAAAMATRRGITLRDMLETLFSRWRTVQSRIATITTELDRVTEAIQAATTIEEVEVVLAGLDWS